MHYGFQQSATFALILFGLLAELILLCSAVCSKLSQKYPQTEPIPPSEGNLLEKEEPIPYFMVFLLTVAATAFTIGQPVIVYYSPFNLWGVAAAGGIVGLLAMPVAAWWVRQKGWWEIAMASIGTVAGSAYLATVLVAFFITLYQAQYD